MHKRSWFWLGFLVATAWHLYARWSYQRWLHRRLDEVLVRVRHHNGTAANTQAVWWLEHA